MAMSVLLVLGGATIRGCCRGFPVYRQGLVARPFPEGPGPILAPARASLRDGRMGHEECNHLAAVVAMRALQFTQSREKRVQPVAHRLEKLALVQVGDVAFENPERRRNRGMKHIRAVVAQATPPEEVDPVHERQLRL